MTRKYERGMNMKKIKKLLLLTCALSVLAAFPACSKAHEVLHDDTFASTEAHRH